MAKVYAQRNAIIYIKNLYFNNVQQITQNYISLSSLIPL